MLGHEAAGGSGFNQALQDAAATAGLRTRTPLRSREPARMLTAAAQAAGAGPSCTPLPTYLCCRAPRCPQGWGRSRLCRPGRWPPLQPPPPSACSSWPRWLSASVRACGPCSELLPGSGGGRDRDSVSVLWLDRRMDTGRMGEGVSPGLWPLGDVASAAACPGGIHPQGHLGGGGFGRVQRKAASLLLPDCSAHKCIPAEVSLCYDIAALHGRDKDPALIKCIEALLKAAFRQNL